MVGVWDDIFALSNSVGVAEREGKSDTAEAESGGIAYIFLKCAFIVSNCVAQGMI